MRTQVSNRIDVSLDKVAVQSVKTMCRFIDKQLVNVQAKIAGWVIKLPGLFWHIQGALNYLKIQNRSVVMPA